MLLFLQQHKCKNENEFKTYTYTYIYMHLYMIAQESYERPRSPKTGQENEHVNVLNYAGRPGACVST